MIEAHTKDRSGSRRLILVADDQADPSRRLVEALRGDSFDVEVAVTGSIALDLAQILIPDLIILDLMRSDPDGIEICRQLRADGLEIPVIFLTARHSVADRIAGLAAGADGYLAKPFNVEEVVAHVDAILRRRRPLPHEVELP